MDVYKDAVIIEADGGSRGNPGIAGSGTVVYTGDHKKVLREIAWVFADKVTNNVAEYRGLINGLRAAAELGAQTVTVFMDSKLVVEQMSGRWKIKHPDMQKLALEARDLMSGFQKVHFEWVPRKRNAKADALANEAMDAAAKGAPEGPLGGGETASEENAGPQDGLFEPTVSENTQAAQPFDFSTQPAECAPVTRIIAVRHGQTPSSAAKLYAGHDDKELTDHGHEQARVLAKDLARRETIDVILSSPLARARQTARYLSTATGVDVTVDDGLLEIDFGAWDGLSFQEARERDPELHERWTTDTAVSPPGGESIQALHRRVTAWRKEVVAQHPGKTVAVVTHVHPIKSLIRQGLGCGPEVFRNLFLDLASWSIIDFSGDSGVIRAVNHVPYLDQAATASKVAGCA